MLRINNKRILSEEWHSFLYTLNTVGIITVEDADTGEIKTLVGIGAGKCKIADIQKIIDYGTVTQLRGI